MVGNNTLNLFDVLGLEIGNDGAVYGYDPTLPGPHNGYEPSLTYPPGKGPADYEVPPGWTLPKSTTQLANEEFNSVAWDFAQGVGSKQRFFGPDSPWTESLRSLPVYDRLKKAIQAEARCHCSNNGSSWIGVRKDWDANANNSAGDIYPDFLKSHQGLASTYTAGSDFFNYILGLRLKSLGGAKASFTVQKIDCMKNQIEYSIVVTNKFRWGSGTRVPWAKDATFWPTIPPDAAKYRKWIGNPGNPSKTADNPFGEYGPLGDISITWFWSEKLPLK